MSCLFFCVTASIDDLGGRKIFFVPDMKLDTEKKISEKFLAIGLETPSV